MTSQSNANPQSQTLPARVPYWQSELIVRAALLEAIRRREFYVLVILTSLFCIGAIVFRFVGTGSPATGTFLLNLGLSLAAMFSQVITLLTAARLIPDEREKRTLYPLLGKPLDRGACLLGKWAACWLIGSITFATLFLLSWGTAPKTAAYHGFTLLQMVWFHWLSLGYLAAWGITLSLLVPKGLNILLAILLVTVSGKAGVLIAGMAEGSSHPGILRWISGYLPNFSRLDLVTYYTDGSPPLSPQEFFARTGVPILYSIFLLAVSVNIFRRASL